MDADGFVYIYGRKKDCLRYKKLADIIYPGVIEMAAKTHDKVSDAQVTLQYINYNILT